MKHQRRALQVIFVHKSSGYLMTADLFWNFPSQGINAGTRAFKFGMDQVSVWDPPLHLACKADVLFSWAVAKWDHAHIVLCACLC